MKRTAECLVSLALFLLVFPPAAWSQEEHRLGGSEVSVFNLAGAVEVVSGSGNEVVVQVMRGGSDAARLEVEVRQVDGRQALVVNYPSDEVVYPKLGRTSRSELQVGNDGTFFGGVRRGDARKVRISGSGNGMEAWADLRITMPAGSDFALFLATGETNLNGLDGTVLIDNGSGRVEARDSRGELIIDTGSGDVLVESFDGALEIDSGSGEVELSDVQGPGIIVDTGSGSVTARGVATEALEVDTGSGEIQLSRIAAPDLVLDTGSGSVEVELLDDVDSLVVDTGSGSVTIRLPASAGARMELDTGSGSIEVDLPFEVRQARRDHVRGVLGDGVGEIHVDTGSGGIRIRGG